MGQAPNGERIAEATPVSRWNAGKVLTTLGARRWRGIDVTMSIETATGGDAAYSNSHGAAQIAAEMLVMDNQLKLPG